MAGSTYLLQMPVVMGTVDELLSKLTTTCTYIMFFVKMLVFLFEICTDYITYSCS
uniref:Uncharacterized protein n=1 Tax=Aegilops tauschii subsp. strangulata TaxID=200361 RepID=A0A453S6C2_AEGTS